MWKKFTFWFTDVFWYHYRWRFLTGLFLLALLPFIISPFLEPKADYEMLLISPYTIQRENLDPLRQILTQCIGDTNGDGKYVYTINSVPLGGDADETMGAYEQRIMALLATPENKLVIVHENMLDFYAENFPFLDGSEYGLPYSTERIPLGQLADKGIIPSYYIGEFYAMVKRESLPTEDDAALWYEKERAVIQHIVDTLPGAKKDGGS